MKNTECSLVSHLSFSDNLIFLRGFKVNNDAAPIKYFCLIYNCKISIWISAHSVVSKEMAEEWKGGVDEGADFFGLMNDPSRVFDSIPYYLLIGMFYTYSFVIK